MGIYEQLKNCNRVSGKPAELKLDELFKTCRELKKLRGDSDSIQIDLNDFPSDEAAVRFICSLSSREGIQNLMMTPVAPRLAFAAQKILKEAA